jgi:uncharacterized protein YciI
LANDRTFIYVTKLTRPGMVSEGPTPEELKTVHEHFFYLKGLRDQGTVLHAGRTGPQGEKTFGIVIFKAGSEGGAREIMSEDPAVKNKVMTAELSPYSVALVGSDWTEAKSE